MSNDLLQMLSVRRGHFRLESGHHGDLWLDLDALFLRPRRLQSFFDDLAERISPYRPDVVCGPLSGGAYVAQAIATRSTSASCMRSAAAMPPRGFFASPTAFL